MSSAVSTTGPGFRFPWGYPWRDPAGRFSALKLAVLVLVLLPGTVVAGRWLAHDLGSRPVTEAIHQTGDWAVRFLLLSLLVTPARALLAWSRVVLLRRMLGLAAAGYVVVHFTLFCVDQKWHPWRIVLEIALRFYLTIGFAALLGLVALSVTSTDGWQRQLRGGWKRLHRLVFPIAVLGLFHYFLQSKADVGNAVFYAGLFFWLAFWRLVPKRWQGRLVVLPLLAVGAGLATVAVEAGWYAAATRIDPLRVLAANLDLEAWRPALQVTLAGAAALVIVIGRRAWQATGSRADGSRG